MEHNGAYRRFGCTNGLHHTAHTAVTMVHWIFLIMMGRDLHPKDRVFENPAYYGVRVLQAFTFDHQRLDLDRPLGDVPEGFDSPRSGLVIIVSGEATIQSRLNVAKSCCLHLVCASNSSVA